MKTFNDFIEEKVNSTAKEIAGLKKLIKDTEKDIKKTKDKDEKYSLSSELDDYKTILDNLIDMSSGE